MLNNAQLIQQDSGKFTYQTPTWITSLAWQVMGSIELDPASSIKSNERIRAERIYTIVDDGLSQTWEANTAWLNHPFSRKGNPLWINKLVSEYEAGNVKQAMCITFASTGAKWFKPLLDYPQCYFYKRINYVDPVTGNTVRGVTKDSVVTYLGDHVDRFYHFFNPYGKIKVAFEPSDTYDPKLEGVLY